MKGSAMRAAAVAGLLLTLAVPARGWAQDGAAHLLIVSGLSGEPRFAEAYRAAGAALLETALTQWRLPPANVAWLAETADVHARVKDRSTRENVEREIRAIAARAGARDRVLIVFYGHGGYANGESRINLPGPDINGKELAALLEPLRAQPVAVVHTGSASGGWIQDLAAPNRVVITATKSGMEQNETVFGVHFTTALTSAAADTDRDGRVSLLEAFEYTRREVEREYERGNKLLTEHAVIDGVGDGRGVAQADGNTPHGRLARGFFMSAGSAGAAAGATPELRALYATRDRLQAELDELRARRGSMSEDAYDAALEKLLVEIATNAQAIRRLEGGRP
jgi:hypothetical protein